MQTNEEAQVSVHDPDLFVTVQLLDDSHTVPSLGKLCEEHCYSLEWTSGQKPQLTESGKIILCKTEMFVPVVVSGLSSSSSASSSSTWFPQGSSRGARIRCRFRSIDAHDEQKSIKPRRDGHSKEVQKP